MFRIKIAGRIIYDIISIQKATHRLYPGPKPPGTAMLQTIIYKIKYDGKEYTHDYSRLPPAFLFLRRL
ncbi:MAG: hypothetical protein HFH93_03310 [Lachnospiraceae bacterium]|nr:hypothetical protein [Lachnospiraceae bacterium]